jgi:uncharacterized BrkB/YihY/UPF0761 family membrane protein
MKRLALFPLIVIMLIVGVSLLVHAWATELAHDMQSHISQ